MEDPSDYTPIDVSSTEDNDGDVTMKPTTTATTTTTKQLEQGPIIHEFPLRLLSHRESYVVNDVLGKSTGLHPDIDHIRVPNKTVLGSGSNNPNHVAAMQPEPSDIVDNNTDDDDNMEADGENEAKQQKISHSDKKDKHVGFAPAPPTYHHRPQNTSHPASTSGVSSNKNKSTVHLMSTDGLVVVSAFLPVVLHRSDAGQWTADWDYEALLSMQTHLRVTRIGVVKWRGWHGNFGSAQSPPPEGQPRRSAMSSGVPINERHLVEECLRPFHCVPVWIDTAVFGEM